jgi:hypothetical protein
MPLDGAESVICAFITSKSKEQIEIPRYPGVGLSVPGSAITGAVESPGVAVGRAGFLVLVGKGVLVGRGVFVGVLVGVFVGVFVKVGVADGVAV